MDERARSFLLLHKMALQRDLRTPYIMDHLVSDEVLSLQEEELVRAQPTQAARAALLLDTLADKDSHAYISLYNALLQEGYSHLAALLQDGLPLRPAPEGQAPLDQSPPYVKSVLCEGGVPQRPVVFVTRPELVHTIRRNLYYLQHSPGWVLVHGMAGCGKSVLAAEAVRDQDVLEDCFPGGVHWVSVGKQDKAGILMKLQNLSTRLEQTGQLSQRPAFNIEEARDRLRLLIMHRHPRCLLILDDIWDSWVLKAFDVQCRVLITSRDRAVLNTVLGSTFVVPVESGLPHDKALEILSLFVDLNIKDLPEQAHEIVKECKGSPLVVSLIGALLRDFPHRWDYYLRQLQLKQFKRIRKSSSYDYEALDEAMSISVDTLPRHLKDYYRDLSVLKKGIRVPTPVFCVLWDMETEEVEDILQEFVNKSLLFCDRNGTSFLYYLHDLQVDFLTEMHQSELQELHSSIVNQYHKHHTNSYLPTSFQGYCMYWYHFLAYHMAGAKMHEQLCSLLFSLNWIKSKTEVLGPAHLIYEFVEYRDILDNHDSTVRGHFQEFLCLNGHLLGRSPFPSIVQLGLCQPKTSAVHKRARLQAKGELDEGAFYLEWINQNNMQNMTSLVVRPHTDAVYHASFSHCGHRIASCGADKTFQIVKAETGENILEVKAHDNEVLCCAFSSDDLFIATCSSDTQVKIWDCTTGQLFRVFEEHTEQVNFCQFTNTECPPLLASCSNDCFVKFWNLSQNDCRNTMFGHVKPVNHCRFSPDDQYLASCSADGTLKFWEVSSANEFKSFNVKKFLNQDEHDKDLDVLVKCCCWSSDCSRIMVAAKNILLIFDFETGDLLTELQVNHHTTIQYCDFCPSNQLVALALAHCSVELWNTETSVKIADCRGHLSWVHCVSFSPNGSSLLTSSEDQTIRLWETGKVSKTTVMVLKREFDVVFADDKLMVLAPDKKRCLQFINGKDGDIIFQTGTHGSSITCCCLSGDLHLAAFGDEDGAVHVLELASARSFNSVMGHTQSVQHCQFTADGKTLISCSDDGTIQIWDWQTEKCTVLQGHKEAVKNFILLDNFRLLSWSFDGTVKLWNRSSGKVEKDFLCHYGAVLSCDVSHDNGKFVSASADTIAKVWNFESSSLIHELKGHQGCVRCCRFSPDSRILATGDDNGEIRLWSVLSGDLLRCCSHLMNEEGIVHVGWVTDLHFSPDGTMLVSAGGYLKWWNVTTGESLQSFYTQGTSPKSIYVSPDFQLFVTIDNLGILYVLKVLV